MFYRLICFWLIISSFGIIFFPGQSSFLRLSGFLFLVYRDGIVKRELRIIALTTIILLAYYLTYFQLGIISFYITLIFSVLCCKYLRHEMFISEFIKVTYIFAKLILLLAVISILINSFQTIALNTSTYSAIGPFLYTYLPSTVLNFNYHRPVLFFQEPGSLQIFFIISLYYEGSKGRFFGKKYLIFSAAVIAGYSSVGMLSLVFITVYFALKQDRLGYRGLIMIFPLLMSYPLFIDNYDDKFNGENSQSSVARIVDIYNGYDLFLEKPFFGHGLITMEEYAQLIGKEYYLEFFPTDRITQESIRSRGNSVGILNILFSFGLLGLLVFIIPFLFLMKQNFMLKVVMLMFLFSQPVIFTPFVIVFLYSLTIKM